MRVLLLVVGVLGVLSVRAHAEPAAVPVVRGASERAAAAPSRFALAVNDPLAWRLSSFGASAYVRVADHWVVRGNVAAYGNYGSLGDLAEGVVGDGLRHGGRVIDTGIAAVLYPRRVWDGVLLEVGALRRDRDTSFWPGFEEPTFTRSTEYAGRALIGWSWLIHQRAFISIAAGLSFGRESGEDTTMPYGGTMITTPVRRMRSDFENYIRVGLVF